MKGKCEGCLNMVPIYELTKNKRCLQCNEWDNSNYRLSARERETTESRLRTNAEVKCDNCKRTFKGWATVRSEKTNWKTVCNQCLKEVERKIEIPPKK